ncbi:MAG: 6,7-dimethyl-8-ribityllumazine synthase [Planctomycetota bacterium]
MDCDTRTIEPSPSNAPRRVAVVVSTYNQWITDALLSGALEAFDRASGSAGHVDVVRVPGTYELPAAAAACARTGRYGAVICLGCVIRGETSHDRYIAESVANGLQRIACGEHGNEPIAVGFGVLTVDNAEQAEARAGGAMGNKGAEAMDAALETASVLLVIESERSAGVNDRT